MFKTILLISLFLTQILFAQSEIIRSLYQDYSEYKETAIETKRFKHKDIMPLIKDLMDSDLMKVKKVGESLQGRDIYLLAMGNGKTNVFAWSQMHGDESTATMALFDIFNFFHTKDQYQSFKENILEKTTLYFIPMLNPDGAAEFKRRNRLFIDLNRDAKRVQFPESKILKGVRDSLDPKFGFNLHDQSTYYTAGRSGNPATISFLAPAFNYNKDINDVRKRTMQLIVELNDVLTNYIPGHIGRYSDDFEPRAFGDNFVKWGTSSVLIESGGYKDDPEKQYIRKLNFIAILSAFNSIANGDYKNADISKYEEIPENERLLFDLLLKKVSIEYEGKKYMIDIGVRRNEKDTDDYSDYYYQSTMEDFGDLSIYSGYDTMNCSDYTVEPGKIFPEKFESLPEIDASKGKRLLENGYTYVVVEDSLDKKFTELPINVISNEAKVKNEMGLNKPANLVLKKDGEIKYLIVNGFIYEPTSETNSIKNCIVY
jgi:hypothetical protein